MPASPTGGVAICSHVHTGLETKCNVKMGGRMSAGSDIINTRDLHQPITDRESKPDVDINQSATGKLNQMGRHQVS